MATGNSGEPCSDDSEHKLVESITNNSRTAPVSAGFTNDRDQSMDSSFSYPVQIRSTIIRESLSYNEWSMDENSLQERRDRQRQGGEENCHNDCNTRVPHDHAKLEQKYKEYSDYIKESFDIGAFTLLFMHHEPGNWLSTIWVKIVLLVLVFVQVVTPFLLFATRLEEYRQDFLELLGIESTHKAFCPNDADDNLTLALSFCVGGMYLGKVAFRLRAKRISKHVKSVLNESKEGGFLQVLVQLDRFMSTTYEALAYICNLGIIFMERGPFAMVLNALVVEFIVQLDDEAKEYYMQIFPPDAYMIRAYMRANNEEPPSQNFDCSSALNHVLIHSFKDTETQISGSETIGYRPFKCVKVNPYLFHASKCFGRISGAVCKVASVLIVTAVIFLPVCKPGTTGTED